MSNATKTTKTPPCCREDGATPEISDLEIREGYRAAKTSHRDKAKSEAWRYGWDKGKAAQIEEVERLIEQEGEEEADPCGTCGGEGDCPDCEPVYAEIYAPPATAGLETFQEIRDRMA